MSSQLFGEYLVEINAVAPDRLLFALICQAERQSSVLRVLSENKVLPRDTLLRLAKLQWESKEDILSLAIRAGLIPKEQAHAIVIRQTESRQLIGEILVEIGAILQPDLDRHLADFEKSRIESRRPNQVSGGTESQSSTLFEFYNLNHGDLEESMVAEYCDLFDTTKLGDLESLLLSWEKSKDPDILRTYFREMHTLKGTARFVKAFLSEKIIHKIEELVSDLIRTSTEIGADIAPQFVDCLLTGLDLLSKIKEQMSEFQSEKEYWDNNQNQMAIEKYCKSLSLCGELCQNIYSNKDISKVTDQF